MSYTIKAVQVSKPVYQVLDYRDDCVFSGSREECEIYAVFFLTQSASEKMKNIIGVLGRISALENKINELRNSR